MHEEKPFEATSSRLARARHEGDVPRSTELSAALALTGGCVALAAIAPTAAAAARIALANSAHGAWSVGPYLILTASAVTPCLLSTACAVCASISVSGGLIVRAPRGDVAKLDPVAGLRRIVSARSALAALRATIAAAVAGAALLPIVGDAFAFGSGGASPEAGASVAIAASQRILGASAALGVVFGILDALHERLAWRRRLRMSFSEMKQDLKQNEGDPQLRNRRRGQHRALIRGSLARLPEATFVVANPHHVAVALEYRPPDIAVPRVLIRAIDAGARLIKARARQLGIPVVEDIVLARTLLATTRVDELIPRACYLAVARIVAALLAQREES